MDNYKEYIITENIELSELSFKNGISAANDTAVTGEASRYIHFFKIPGELVKLKKGDKLKLYHHNEEDIIIYPTKVTQFINGKEYNSEGYYEIILENFDEIKRKLKLID